MLLILKTLHLEMKRIILWKNHIFKMFCKVLWMNRSVIDNIGFVIINLNLSNIIHTIYIAIAIVEITNEHKNKFGYVSGRLLIYLKKIGAI